MSYNITVLDRTGAFRTVQIAPDREPVVQQESYTTNHQGSVEWFEHAHATQTIERERTVMQRLEDFPDDSARFIDSFLTPPLHSTAYGQGYGTLYTAVYFKDISRKGAKIAKEAPGCGEARTASIEGRSGFSPTRPKPAFRAFPCWARSSPPEGRPQPDLHSRS